MSALLGSDVGKASIGTFKHRGVPAGTVLLEAIHRVECPLIDTVYKLPLIDFSERFIKQSKAQGVQHSRLPCAICSNNKS